jgi:hypothetical protein
MFSTTRAMDLNSDLDRSNDFLTTHASPKMNEHANSTRPSTLSPPKSGRLRSRHYRTHAASVGDVLIRRGATSLERRPKFTKVDKSKVDPPPTPVLQCELCGCSSFLSMPPRSSSTMASRMLSQHAKSAEKWASQVTISPKTCDISRGVSVRRRATFFGK